METIIRSDSLRPAVTSLRAVGDLARFSSWCREVSKPLAKLKDEENWREAGSTRLPKGEAYVPAIVYKGLSNSRRRRCSTGSLENPAKRDDDEYVIIGCRSQSFDREEARRQSNNQARLSLQATRDEGGCDAIPHEESVTSEQDLIYIRDCGDTASEGPGENQNTETKEGKRMKPMKLQFWKTKMCPWMAAMGNCRKGSNCHYAHTQEELRPLPNLEKTKMCPVLTENGQCLNRRACRYAHSVEELRATTSFVKTKLCPFWMQGSCSSGPECRYAHGEHELRDSHEDGTLDLPQSLPGGDPGKSSKRGSYPRRTGRRPGYPRTQEQKARRYSGWSQYQQQQRQQAFQSIIPETNQWRQQQTYHVGQQSQYSGSISDPAILFQELSPVSLNVATNALVYLAESQHNWSLNPSIPNSMGHAFGTTNDPSNIPYQASSPQYAQFLFRQNPLVPPQTLWDSTAGTNAGHLMHGPTDQSQMYQPYACQTPTSGMGQSVMQFFSSSLSTPIRPSSSSAYSPMPFSSTTGKAGGDTGRYMTTHLLPAGMFSPMGPAPTDSTPDTTLECTSNRFPSDRPAVPNMNSPQQSHSLQECFPSGDDPQFLTWGSGVMPDSTPFVFPMDPAMQHNNETHNSSNQSPKLFLPARHNQPGNSSTFSPLPLLPNSPPPERTVSMSQQASGTFHHPASSPSYFPSRGFLPPLLRTHNTPSYRPVNVPDVPPLIPGFPLQMKSSPQPVEGVQWIALDDRAYRKQIEEQQYWQPGNTAQQEQQRSPLDYSPSLFSSKSSSEGTSTGSPIVTSSRTTTATIASTQASKNV